MKIMKYPLLACVPALAALAVTGCVARGHQDITALNLPAVHNPSLDTASLDIPSNLRVPKDGTGSAKLTEPTIRRKPRRSLRF